MAAPIELNFYDENDEVTETFRISKIRFGVLKKAAKLQNQIDGKPAEEASDAISGFVVEMFGDRFSIQDLETKADLSEVMAIFQSINARAAQLSGPENFQPGRA